MGKMKENPRYAIVSMRISDAELDELQDMRRKNESWDSVIYRKVFGRDKL